MAFGSNYLGTGTYPKGMGISISISISIRINISNTSHALRSKGGKNIKTVSRGYLIGS